MKASIPSKLLTLASRVLEKSSRTSPADSVLRAELRSQRGWTQDESEIVTRLVFAYYRWLGWLDQSATVQTKLNQALDLSERFALEPASFAAEELVQNSVPIWLKEEMEVTPEFVRALQTVPKLWLRARPGQGSALCQQLEDCRVFGGPFPDALEYKGTQDLFRTKEFQAGKFELQDLSSQSVGLLCAPSPGETWWDACAGEGGKLLHLADLMENRGLVWGSDRVAWRLQKLKLRAARARLFNYRTAPWNGGARLPTKTKFDGVLVDAPCSGVGTWHRNPHARWTTLVSDVHELREVQIQLLRNAANGLKPGGKIIYAVCTLTRSETVEVVEAFEAQLRGFQRLALTNPMNKETNDSVTIRPQDFGGNGMFIAAWTQKTT